MLPADPRSEQALLVALASGDPGAAETFIARPAALLQSICRSVTPDARSQAAAYQDLMASSDLAAIFAGFDGRSKLRTYVDAAVVTRFLFPRLLARLGQDAAVYAGEFMGFFRRDIARVVRQRVAGREAREDAAQWIREQLLKNDCRHLKTFAAEARSMGFVVVKLKLFLRDYLRSGDAPSEERPRTLPEALADLPAFEQDVYKQFYWWHASSAQMALLALLQRYPAATEATVREALARVEALVGWVGTPTPPSPGGDDDDTIEIPDPNPPGPFEGVESGAFRRAVLEAARTLSDQEKLCLLKRLEGKKASEIARELGISSSAAYELMRKVLDKLRKALIHDPAARKYIATVTGNDDYLDPDRMADAAAGSRSSKHKGADR